jgi:ADP-ribose pyrophosphatase YjhB (NUDIX family)
MGPTGRLKLVADVTLTAGNRVLLVKYRETRKYDHQAGWFLPDDYMQRLEHPEDAALRILRDQVGIEMQGLDLGFIESFEGNGAWHLVFHFLASVEDASLVRPGPNTASAEWFAYSSLPSRSDVAHGGWALDVIEVMSRPRDLVAHTRSVVM